MIGLAALGVVAAGGIAWRAHAREAAALAAYPPSGQLVDVDGTQVHAHVAGTGPDLILIHGAGGHLRDFTFDMVERLSDRYRVIAFDRPGHGYTGLPRDVSSRAITPRVQARLLQKAARQLGVERPLVVGQSFGGAVAMAWALEDPGFTAGLAIVSGATMPWEGGLDAHYHINAHPLGSALVVPTLTALTPARVTDNVVRAIFAPDAMPEGYLEHFAVPLATRRSVLRANSRQVVALHPSVVEMSAHYPTVTVPVEILHGTADTIVGLDVHARPLSRLVPDATLTVLEGVGHMPHHAAAAEVDAAIDRLAARAGLRGPGGAR